MSCFQQRHAACTETKNSVRPELVEGRYENSPFTVLPFDKLRANEI